MNQKSFYIFLFIFFSFVKAYSQKEVERTICCCSNIIEQLSEGWKKDSLNSGGYRLANYKPLLNCKIDSATSDYILNKMGNPQSQGFSKKEVTYLYYFFDRHSISKKNLEDLIGIRFSFNREDNQLFHIEPILNDF